jgi:hypothetical protein
MGLHIWVGAVADVWNSLSPAWGVEATASYEILMPNTIIQYRIFAAFGATEGTNGHGRVQEVAVFENTLGARVGARASAQ